MAKQIIDIGSGELIGDGETIREAFRKANENFTELYSDDADFETQFNTHLNTASAGTNHILSWDGSDYVWRVDNDTIGIQLTDLSVNFVEGAADGDGSLLYDQGSGVFQYSPPKLNGLLADGDTDFGSNKIKYANMYPTLGDLPNASVYHGMFAHVHATGKGYFAHGGNWVELANQSDIVGTFSGLSGKPTTIAGYGITDALTGVADDTTPQLGGDLDVNGNTIVSNGGVLKLSTTQGNDNIQLETNGTGNVLLKGDKVGIGTVNQPDTLLHLKDTNSVITLQRTADANTPGLSFQNSNGNSRAELKMDGTSGTSNEVFIKTDNQDGNGLVERLRVGHTGVTIAGTLNGHTIPAGSGTIALTSDITGASDTDALAEGTTNLYYTDARVGTYLGNNDYDTATNIVASITDSAPATLDTLNELAAALGDDPNFATTVTTSIAEKLPLAGGTMTGDLDVGGNKVLFGNMYATEGDLPNASTYHGMFAHVHNTGLGYFAHGGTWVKLANKSELGNYTTTVNLPSAIDSHLNQSGPTSGYVLSWDGADYAWVAGSGGGLANVVEDTTPQLGGDLDCQGFNITMDNGIISTSAGNLQISSFNYVTIDSANDGQIEIGRSSGTGNVIIGKESNGTSVSFEGVASFDEQVLMYKGAEEKYSALTGATGTVAHDCDNGKMFYHTTPAADWTANFTNLNLNQYKFSTSVGIVVTQGNTAYIPNAVEIGGVAQTIIWQGNSTPTGTDNGTDAISFTIMRDGSTYIVLGQLTSFGGV